MIYQRKPFTAPMPATAQPQPWPAVVLALIAIMFATAAILIVTTHRTSAPVEHQPPPVYRPAPAATVSV